MGAKSTSTRYGTVAVTIHWITALLLLALIVSGFRASDMEDAAAKAAILRVHVPLGIAILVLTLARIAWWVFADKKPKPISMPAWQDRSAKAVHFGFYIVILGMAASGMGMLALSGAGTIIFDGAPETLPDFMNYAPRVPHGIGARATIILFAFHAGAAFYHEFVKRDRLLSRMWYGLQ